MHQACFNWLYPLLLDVWSITTVTKDLVMPTATKTLTSWSDYVQNWKEQLKEAHLLALQHSDDRKSKYVSKNSTKKACIATLEPGDKVLIWNLSNLGGTGKLRNYWEQQVHVIVSRVGKNRLAYKVRPEYGSDRILRILHRNMLIYCDDLLENYNWKIRQNSQFTNPESPQRPLRQAHRSKKKTSAACEDSEAACESDHDINVQFTPEQLNFLAGMRIQGYQDTQRVESLKMSSIASKETLVHGSDRGVEKGIKNARGEEILEKK